MTPDRKERARLARAPVAPVILGPKNCESATGWTWTFVRTKALELGVPLIKCGAKHGVRADLFLAALEDSGRAPAAPVEPEPTTPAAPLDPAAEVRRRLGLVRRAG